MPNSATSVAVSKPSPNRNPIGNICQLLVTSRNSGRNMRDEEPRLIEQDVEIVLRERLAAFDRLKGSVDGDQHENVDEGEANRKSAEALVLKMPPTAFSESKRDVSADAGERQLRPREARPRPSGQAKRRSRRRPAAGLAASACA